MMNVQLAYASAFGLFFVILGRILWNALQDYLKNYQDSVLSPFDDAEKVFLQAQKDLEVARKERDSLSERLEQMERLATEEIQFIEKEVKEKLEEHLKHYEKILPETLEVLKTEWKKGVLEELWKKIFQGIQKKGNLQNSQKNSSHLENSIEKGFSALEKK